MMRDVKQNIGLFSPWVHEANQGEVKGIFRHNFANVST